jgi:tetratricopeptide (TPR) repeat protein
MIKIFQADYGDSYEAYFEALRYFEQCNSQEGIVVALNGIGNICYYQRNFTKADIYYSQALKKAREIRDTFQIANVLNNVGLVLVERSQVEKAIGCYQEAIGIHKSLGLKLRLATNYINLSIAYLTMNRFDDFNSNYSMAFEIYASLGSRQNQAMCYLMYYDYCKQINDSENQLKYAMMAYGDGVKYNLRSVVSQAAEVLHEFYLSAGKIDSAYKYAMIWNAEKDSIDNEQATARLTLLEMEYTYDKQQKEANIKQQRKDFITIILIILGTSALITTILFLSRQIVKTKNIRLEKQRLSDVVEFKDKELTLNVMNLIKKNEIFVDLSNRLIQMEQKTTDPAMKQEIIQLINSLQRNSSQEMWEEFEVRFRQVHNSYYEKLLVRFPELSPSELKLCALLRLNLSTKEICELSGQRPSTLDVARYRLRKKLGLSNSQVNLVTFLSQV